jgi:quercetin dioxygenase-like cupin family protein
LVLLDVSAEVHPAAKEKAMRIKQIVLALTACAALAGSVAPCESAHAEGQGQIVTPIFAHLISNIRGKSLIAVEVTYAPGGWSPPHRHANSAFIFAYVVSGSISSQVGSEPARVYRAGESFFEVPGSHHRVSRNASDTQPAKLLAVFVVDTDDKILTTPDK